MTKKIGTGKQLAKQAITDDQDKALDWLSRSSLESRASVVRHLLQREFEKLNRKDLI